jgi:hypothetical protein
VTKLGNDTSVRFQPESITTMCGRPSKNGPEYDQLTARTLYSYNLFPAPTSEENDLGNGLTLKHIWDKLDFAIARSIEIEWEDHPIDRLKSIAKKQGNVLCELFGKVQLSIDQQTQRRTNAIYIQWCKDPSKVDACWREYFADATPEELEKAIGRTP